MESGPPKVKSARLAAALAGRDVACHGCGHNLRGVEEVFCPECGVVIAAPAAGEPVAALAAGPGWLSWWRHAVGAAAAVLLLVSLARLEHWTGGPVLSVRAIGTLAAAAAAAVSALAAVELVPLARGWLLPGRGGAVGVGVGACVAGTGLLGVAVLLAALGWAG